MSDGNTLLGADNKAGIAIIMTAIEKLRATDNAQFGDVYIAFVPDEEIGHQLALLDLKQFMPKIAFTIDGGAEGEIEYGCFQAESGIINIIGKECILAMQMGVLSLPLKLLASFMKV